MSILIRGMEMPKWNKNLERVEKIIISSSGLVEWVDDNNTLLAEYEAIELPPHGRLIDADALSQMFDSDESFGAAVLDIIADTPTIIESENDDG